LWNYTQIDFSGDHILAHTGCCAPKFLHVLENDQVLLVHPHWGRWYLLQFFSNGVKNWLKIQHVSTYNFGRRESNPT